ncbi:dimethylglycine dehydrogenase, mitochondrial-like [Ischnura elegans]|uniref:dimethylglycine dehydrogenase, mitochondrial-like n=1 Tax=Ischnura elegans TaxID=197161 RepID=UPI001ED882C9|nr:dimethylglycine dehydrogenase, mitochondrial-like [Ischnura elegans]XP_046383380.1 dimethylglycine dehydrogenase, mitochondrial-like [Ischnura elegans]
MWKTLVKRAVAKNAQYINIGSRSSSVATNVNVLENIDGAAKTENPLDRTLPETAETVIIGGGAIGCSLAYHLTKMGQKKVILLEKSELTAGSTWHAAGLTALYHPTPNLKRINYYSINLYAQLEAETGQAVGFHQPGSIRLATSPVRVDEFRFQMSRQQHKDAPQMLIDPDAIQKLVPFMNMETILAGLYNPNDGHIDPYSMTQALAAGARSRGAEIYLDTEVVAMERLTALHKFAPNGWEIHTAKGGSIVTKRVVNATGFWAREVGRLAGLKPDLPLVPVEHQYAVTAPIPEVQEYMKNDNGPKKEIPVLRHLDGSFYLRQERSGLLIGPYESQESMKLRDEWVLAGVPPGFGKELFQPDLDRLAPHLDIAMKLIPCLADASIPTVVSGPITYTPDLLPMVGPSLMPNMWLAVGFGYGIIHAGGIGNYLAQWIINGEPPFELNELDPLRFSHWTHLRYTFAKARESYGLNNAVTYPHEERFAGRPTARVSGAHSHLLTRGAHMDFHSGWEQPAWFSCQTEEGFQHPEYKPSFRRTNWHQPVQRECQLVKESVGIIDLSPFAKFHLSGPDATEFLDYVTANSVPKKPGRSVVTHCLTRAGTVYAELTVTSLPISDPSQDPHYMIVTGSGSELHDLRWLNELASLEKKDVVIENLTDNYGCLSIAGPKSGELLAKLKDGGILPQFPFMSAKELLLAGKVRVTALRITYTGELGWEIYCPHKDIDSVYALLLNAGADLGVGDFGTRALNVLRMEKGFRMWGADMNVDTSPFEAGLAPFIKMDKGNFIGRDALVEQLKHGLKKTLVYLAVDSEDVDPIGDEAVWSSGKVIGNTTSGCFSHALKKPLAFAYVPPFLSTPGTKVQVELLGKLNEATVLSEPVMETYPQRIRKTKKT